MMPVQIDFVFLQIFVFVLWNQMIHAADKKDPINKSFLEIATNIRNFAALNQLSCKWLWTKWCIDESGE